MFCELGLFVVFIEILKINTQPDSVQWVDYMCVKLLNGLSVDFFSSSFAFAYSLGTERLVNLFFPCFPSCFKAEVRWNISVEREFWDRNNNKLKIMKFIRSLLLC